MASDEQGGQEQPWRFDPAALEALLSVVTRLAPTEDELPAGGSRQERADYRRAAVLAHARDIARQAG